MAQTKADAGDATTAKWGTVAGGDVAGGVGGDVGVGMEPVLAPPTRTKWTRRVLHPVLIGHAASLSQVGMEPVVGAVDDFPQIGRLPSDGTAGARLRATAKVVGALSASGRVIQDAANVNVVASEPCRVLVLRKDVRDAIEKTHPLELLKWYLSDGNDARGWDAIPEAVRVGWHTTTPACGPTSLGARRPV